MKHWHIVLILLFVLFSGVSMAGPLSSRTVEKTFKTWAKKSNRKTTMSRKKAREKLYKSILDKKIKTAGKVKNVAPDAEGLIRVDITLVNTKSKSSPILITASIITVASSTVEKLKVGSTYRFYGKIIKLKALKIQGIEGANGHILIHTDSLIKKQELAKTMEKVENL